MARQWTVLIAPAQPETGEELSPFSPAAYVVGSREEILAKIDAWIQEQERQLDELASGYSEVRH